MKDGVKKPVFKFTNEKGQTVNCEVKIMNPLSGEPDEFCQKLASLQSLRKLDLLALLLNILPKASGFTDCDENFFDELGFRKNEDALKEVSGVGGTLDEVKSFIAIAKQCASVFVPPSSSRCSTPIKRFFTVDNEKTEASKKARLSKAEMKEEQRKKEIQDPDGLEKKFVDSYFGFADLKLDQLMPLPELKKEVNSFKVLGIANKIKERPDPSLLSMTVAPNIECKDVEKKYHVIGGVHSLLALQMLDKEGELSKIPVLCEKIVPCIIVNTADKDLLLYGNLRTNDLNAEFISKPRSQDLLKIFQNYLDKPVQGTKVIKRMATLQDLHHTESAAILRLIKWEKKSFTDLLEVVKKFETYQTKDAVEKKSGTNAQFKRLSKGLTNKMSAKMLISLSKFDPNDFQKYVGPILSQEVSLQSIVDPTEDKATMNVSNLSNTPEVSIDIQQSWDWDEAFSETSDLDIIVVDESVSSKRVLMENIIKKNVSTLLIFEEESIFTDAMTFLRENRTWCVPILMEKMDDVDVENVNENVQFCILTGKDKNVIKHPPIKMLNGPECMSLCSLVDQLTLPRSNIYIYSETKIVRVDRSDNCKLVEYRVRTAASQRFIDEFKDYPELSITKTKGKSSSESHAPAEGSASNKPGLDNVHQGEKNSNKVDNVNNKSSEDMFKDSHSDTGPSSSIIEKDSNLTKSKKLVEPDSTKRSDPEVLHASSDLNSESILNEFNEEFDDPYSFKEDPN